MKKVTYLENGIRTTRTCDFIDRDEQGNYVLCYKDGLDDIGRGVYRTNVLSPGTVIEKVEDVA